jgi:hypothetical protein
VPVAWGQDLGVAPTWSTGPNGFPQWTDPFSRPDFVRASDLGGSATITLVPPHAGPQTLSVRSYDRAFNASAVTTTEQRTR